MSEEQSVQGQLYRVDNPLYTFSTVEKNGDVKIVLKHRFTRLDSVNESLYIKREEKDMVNQSEEIGKGRTRAKRSSQLADVNLYDALIAKGAWLPYGLSDEEKKTYKAEELTKQQMLDLDPEPKIRAIKRMFECDFVVKSTGAEGVNFLFQKDAFVEGEFYIGDKRNPAFVIPMKFKRPTPQRRSDFRLALYTVDDLRKADLALRETVQHPRAGTNFFNEHLVSVGNVEFSDGNGGAVPYTDEKLQDFLRFFNPIYKVEAAADLATAFDNDEEE